MDLHGGLVVLGGGEDLALAGGDGGVPGDEDGHHPALGLHAQGEGGDVQKDHVPDLPHEHPGLDGGPHGHHLVGVHGAVGLLAQKLPHHLLHRGHPGGPAHEDHLVNLGGGEARVLQGLLHGAPEALEEGLDQLLKLGPGELLLQVEGGLARGVQGDEGQADGGLQGAGELNLGLLRRLNEPLQGLAVGLEVHAVLLLELLGEPVDDGVVHVRPAQVGVPGGGLHLKDPLADLQDGDVKGPASQVKDEDGLVPLLVQAVGQSGGGGLVDDAQDLKPRDPAGVGRGLPLGVVEVGGHGDHRLGDLFPELLGGVLHQLAEDHGADLLGGVELALDLHPHAPVRPGDHLVGDPLGLLLDLLKAAADEALDLKDRPLGVQDRLALGHAAHQGLPVAEGHHARGDPFPFRVFQHHGLAALQDGDHAVGGAQVNAHCLGHTSSPRLPG